MVLCNVYIYIFFAKEGLWYTSHCCKLSYCKLAGVLVMEELGMQSLSFFQTSRPITGSCNLNSIVPHLHPYKDIYQYAAGSAVHISHASLYVEEGV